MVQKNIIYTVTTCNTPSPNSYTRGIIQNVHS